MRVCLTCVILLAGAPGCTGESARAADAVGETAADMPDIASEVADAAAEALPDAVAPDARKPGACDDGTPCTDDASTPGGCSHVIQVGVPCDDGAICTENDTCAANGKCTGPFCDDVDACTARVCTYKGCVEKWGCSDGDSCTTDTCIQAAGPRIAACSHAPIAGCTSCADFACPPPPGPCASVSCVDDVCVVSQDDAGTACGAINGCQQPKCTVLNACVDQVLVGQVCGPGAGCTKQVCDAAGACVGEVDPGKLCDVAKADRNSKAHRFRGHHQNPTDSRRRTIQKHRRPAVCPTPSARQPSKPFGISGIERTNPAQRQLSLLCARAG